MKRPPRSLPRFETTPELKDAARTVKNAVSRLIDELKPDQPIKFPDDVGWRKAQTLLIEEEIRRFDLLYEHFQIDDRGLVTRDTKLLRALARALIPNFDPFKIAHARGRPKSALQKHGALVEEIDRRRAETGGTIGRICLKLSNEKKGPYSGRDPKELEGAYFRTKRLFDQLRSPTSENGE